LNRCSLSLHLEPFFDGIFISHELKYNVGIVFCLVDSYHWISPPYYWEFI
jgi:hypothetical protein